MTGLISPAHARVIITAVENIPEALAAEWEERVEADLVGFANELDAGRLAKAARHHLDYLDPDGTLADDADHDRRREFLLCKRRDGSAQSQTYFAPDLTALIEAYLDTYAAPSRLRMGRRTGGRPGSGTTTRSAPGSPTS